MAKTNRKRANSDKSCQLQRERSKDCMKKLREKIRNDPVLYEKYKQKEKERYLVRKAEGKIKTIDQLNDREKRKMRKEWRVRSKKSYDEKKKRLEVQKRLEENTPPASPVAFEPLDQQPSGSQDMCSRQAVQRKQIQRRNRESLKREIKQLQEKLREREKKIAKFKKKVQRMKKKLPDTPNKKVRDMLEGQSVTPEVKRSLVLSEAVKQQINVNFKNSKTALEKRKFISNISANIVKKYRFKTLLGHTTSRNIIQTNSIRLPKKRQLMVERIRKTVEDFFEKDSVSRLCLGKKDTITFKKVKKQKRYLNWTLLSIYDQFKKKYPQIKISYQSFCNFRPFWVLKPNARLRETCSLS